MAKKAELIHYDAACRAIGQAVATDEVLRIRDKAAMMKMYARQAKNRELEIQAAEIRHRAERRVGQLIDQQRATVGLAKGTRGALKGRHASGGARLAPPEK